MKTIAQQLNITEFPFEIKDSKGNLIYYESSDGYWYRGEYDSKGNEIYCENNFNNNCENSNGIIEGMMT